MNLELLEEKIKDEKIDEAIKLISEIGSKKFEKAIPYLIRFLKSTENNRLRNSIAIALSDIGSSEAVVPIIEMIKHPRTKKSRGTLLYALEGFDIKEHVGSLVYLLFEDGFEESRQTLILIESAIKDIPEQEKEKYRQEVKNYIDKLKDKIVFLFEVLNVLKM